MSFNNQFANLTTVTQPYPTLDQLALEKQARFVDISFWYRMGGIDWARLKDTVSGVIIRAGQGYFGYDSLLHHHIDKANEFGVPYHTYWQLDPRQAIVEQMNTWLSGYGVAGHKMCAAVENTGGGLVTSSNCAQAFGYLEQCTDDEIYGYSRIRILKLVFNDPDWIYDYPWLIAQYPYETADLQYRRWDAYEADHAYEYPKDVDTFNMQALPIWGHQFTEKLDAQFYFANAYTEDPNNRVGLKNGDGIISMEPASIAVRWFTDAPSPTDPPPSDIIDRLIIVETKVEAMKSTQDYIVSTLTALEEAMGAFVDWAITTDQRLDDLESGAPSPTDPPPSGDYITVTAKENVPVGIAVGHDKACDGQDPPGKPIIEHPPVGERIVYSAGDPIQVHAKYAYSCKDNPDTPTILASGGVLHYVVVDGYPGKVSFVRADKVTL